MLSIMRKGLAPIAGIVIISLLSGCISLGNWFGGRSAHECLVRAMYFESNRSSEEGMLAVGTVVMNRVHDKAFPNDVCGVVGQKNQFASGVLQRPMNERRPVELASRVAHEVLRGKRHPGVQDAKYFHTAGLTFPYRNMHYVLVAGGNAFYARR